MRSRKAGFPFATRARKREPCLQRYVSRMTRTEKKFSKFFWKPLFSTFYGTLFIISQKYFFGFSKSAPTPRYTILDSRLPPCNAISEGRLPLCNTSSEAGALPSEVRIENDSDRKFSVNFFSKFFWKPLFSTFYGTLFIISRKYFFGILKAAPTPRYTNQKVQLQLDKSKSPAVDGLFIANKKSRATAGLIKKSSCSWTFLLVLYKGSKFSKSIFSQSFSGNHFSPRFLVPFPLLAENIFSVFRSPHLPLDTPFWTRGFPLVMRSRKAGFPFATRARKREPCLQRYVSRMTRTEKILLGDAKNLVENNFIQL